MPKTHTYDIDLTWTGNLGSGTVDYRAYSRDHDVTAGDKPAINGSADPGFFGARERWNPEELLVVSLSQCHMLWYLGLAAREGLIVTAYEDHPTGSMVEERDGAGQFVNVTLRPEVTIADGRTREAAIRLHSAAHEKCFIARSVNFTVTHEATIKVTPA